MRSVWAQPRPGAPTGPIEIDLQVEVRTEATLAPEPQRSAYAAPAPLRRGRGWYAGDLHVHSLQSGDADPDATLFHNARNDDGWPL